MTNAAPLCIDCQSNDSDIEIRKRLLCYACFRKYATSKVLKRMDTFRFKNISNDSSQVGKRRLLLPLSGGVSSLVLLQVLDAQIKRQLAQQSRTAYDLVLCHVSYSSIDQSVVRWWDDINSTFNLHTHVPIFSLSDVLTYDLRIEAGMALLGFSRQDDGDNTMFLDSCFASTRTSTARADLQTILLRRLIISIARRNDCQGILWGHSDSALAALALSAVAQGRGGALSSELADGLSPWGVSFNYPLRDLYRTELEMYLHSLPESISDCLLQRNTERGGQTETPISLRLMSIDQLLGNYVEGQGEKYPGIMANVVRTVGKLKPDHVDEDRRCRICAASVEEKDVAGSLCYGCLRLKQDIKMR